MLSEKQVKARIGPEKQTKTLRTIKCCINLNLVVTYAKTLVHMLRQNVHKNECGMCGTTIMFDH